MYYHCWNPMGQPGPLVVRAALPVKNAMKLDVDQDKQEKLPIKFPGTVVLDDGRLAQVRVNGVSMKTGDYRLTKFPGAVGIERKGKATELYACFVGGRRAACRDQLDRMVMAYEYPVLMLDNDPHTILTYDYTKFGMKGTKTTGARILRSILYEAGTRRMGVVWFGRSEVGTKVYSAGELVLGILLSGLKIFQAKLASTPELLYPSISDALESPPVEVKHESA